MSLLLSQELTLKQQAARMLLMRRRARSNVFDYANAIDIPGKPATNDPDSEFFLPVETTIAHHHRLILDAFEKTSQTKHGRLMVFLPPGSAKSTYGSVVFPSRYLGGEAGRKIILASYGDDLSRKMGRRTRAICKTAKYRNIYNTELSKESSAAETWALTNGSEYMSCGIMAGITGNRANGIIIDDPIKGRAEANSDVIRNRTWDAYRDDLLTRLIPGGWVALIQTRWHEDDLAGRILPIDWKGESGMIECRDGNIWNVLCIQAEAQDGNNDPLNRKHGEMLWPEWFDKKHWDQFRKISRTWASLFQQIPTPLEGDLFKPDNIPIITALPKLPIEWVRGWDFGATANGGDYTAGPKLGKLPDGRFIIADMVRFQKGVDDRDAALLNTAIRDGYECRQSIPQDPGAAGKSQVKYMAKMLSGYRVHASVEGGSKEVRSEALASQCNVGNVLMLRADWNDELISEMRSFPNGSHDDQVDGLSRAFNLLIGNNPGQIFIPEIDEKKVIDGLPHHVSEALQNKYDNVCGSCSSFIKETGNCDYRNIIVRQEDIACDSFIS